MNITVKDTKIHKIRNGEEPFDYGDVISVTEAQLILVECLREESCFYILPSGFPRIRLYNPNLDYPIKGIGRYYKPILISLTEHPEI